MKSEQIKAMKILFLTSQLPYPPVSGGAIKSFKLLEFLVINHQVSLGCLLKNHEDEQNLATLQALQPSMPVHTAVLNIPRTGLNFAKSILAAIPLTIYRNRCETLSRKINQIADVQEVIFVDHDLMYQYVPRTYKGRVVVHQHNAEFVIWSSMAAQCNNIFKKWLLNFEANRIRRYEVAMCNSVDAVLAAPNDKQALVKAGVHGEHFYQTYHLGDEENLSLPALQYSQTQAKVLFIGTLSWEANVDGLVWFLKHCWPLIEAQYPGVIFTIVGKHTDKLAKRLRELAPQIEMPGFIEDLEYVFQQHRVFVAPLRFGSGIKVKVVNGLYRGIPTVTTSVGAEGLDLNTTEHLYIEDEPDRYAAAVVTLLKNQTIWQCLSNQSRQRMKALYTWDVVFENVNRSLTGASTAND